MLAGSPGATGHSQGHRAPPSTPRPPGDSIQPATGVLPVEVSLGRGEARPSSRTPGWLGVEPPRPALPAGRKERVYRLLEEVFKEPSPALGLPRQRGGCAPAGRVLRGLRQQKPTAKQLPPAHIKAGHLFSTSCLISKPVFFIISLPTDTMKYIAHLDMGADLWRTTCAERFDVGSRISKDRKKPLPWF